MMFNKLPSRVFNDSRLSYISIYDYSVLEDASDVFLNELTKFSQKVDSKHIMFDIIELMYNPTDVRHNIQSKPQYQFDVDNLPADLKAALSYKIKINPSDDNQNNSVQILFDGKKSIQKSREQIGTTYFEFLFSFGFEIGFYDEQPKWAMLASRGCEWLIVGLSEIALSAFKATILKSQICEKYRFKNLSEALQVGPFQKEFKKEIIKNYSAYFFESN